MVGGPMSVALQRIGEPYGQARITAVAWVADEELAYEEWLRQGSRLGLASRSAAWWIGDWVRYGTAKYGDKYSAAVRVTGYDRQTLMNMVYVATRFDVSRRRETLSWSHHAELAPLEQDDQEAWLNRAVSDRLSVRDLREALAPVKQRAARPAPKPSETVAPGTARDGASAAVNSTAIDSRSTSVHDETAREVVCPHCGHHFVP